MCSLPVSETMISTASPIAELIRHVKYSFRKRVFNEVQNILTDRESQLKSEIEGLVRQRDSAIEDARSSRKECEELEETIAKLKRAEERNSQLVADLNATISELKLENSEANRTIDKLGLEQSQSEFNKRRLEDLGSRIIEIEKLLSDMLNMKVVDPANARLVSEMCKLVTSGREDLNFQDFGGKNDHYSRIRRMPDNSNKEGPRASSAIISGEPRFSKFACSASGDMTDSDDREANPESKKETEFEKLVQSSSSCQRNSKRDRAGLGEDILANWITKRKRTTCSSEEDNNNNTNAVTVDTKKTSPQKLDSFSDEDSTDSDGSCSDSKISDLIASLKSKKH